MSPQTAQIICQIGIALFGTLVAICGYGSFHFGQIITQNELTRTESKISTEFKEATGDRQEKHEKITEKLNENNQLIDERTRPRQLSEATISMMNHALPHTGQMNAEIHVMRNDIEANELSQQLKEILENGGWEISISVIDIIDPSMKRGLKLYFGETPNGAVQAVFKPIFDQFGYQKDVFRDEKIGKNKARIYVGPK